MKQQPENSSLLEAVEALAPQIAARADETEKNRTIAPDIMQALRSAGLFRMMIPRRYGGEELSQLQALRVIETLSKADAVAGWNAMVIYGFNLLFGRFPKPVVEKLFDRSADVVARGALAPLGVAKPVDGGYVVSGRWPFASGCYAPEWVVATCVVKGEGGPPDVRTMLLPPDSVEFLDTWDSVGLRGSSSHDFVVKEAFVPRDHTTNMFNPATPCAFETPLLKLPFAMLTGATHTAVVVGAARGALEDVAELARTKRGAFTPTMRLAEDMVFQHKLGELTARLDAVRALMDSQAEKAWRMAHGETPPTPLDFARTAGGVGWSHVECMDIINEAFALAGGTPVYMKSSIQRRWRDARCAAQHVGASTASYRTLGALLAGETVRSPWES